MQASKQRELKRICVFCGARDGKNPKYLEASVEMGKELYKQNISLVYGGGTVGLMGRVSKTVHELGGEVIGVMPKALLPVELSGHKTGQLIEVESMHERKAKMAELSDAFIVLPGGYGTFEEMFEVITWLQLGIHSKPLGLLNVDGYYDFLLKFNQKAIEEGFIMRDLIVAGENPADLIRKLEEFRSPVGIIHSLRRDET